MKIVYADHEGGDWAALYIDGERVAQGHSLDARTVMKSLGFSWEEIEYTNEQVEEGDAFPPCLKEEGTG